MIFAGQDADIAFIFGHDRVRSVATDIVKPIQVSFPVEAEEERKASLVILNKVTRLGKTAAMRHQ